MLRCLSLYFFSYTAFAQGYGENNIREEVMLYQSQAIVESMRRDIVNSIKNFDLSKYNFESLKAMAPNQEIRDRLNEVAKNIGTEDFLIVGRWLGDEYIVDLGEHSIRYSIDDLIFERVRVGDHKFQLNSGEEFGELFERLENFIVNEVLGHKETRFSPIKDLYESIVGLVFPKAIASNRDIDFNRYRDLIIINSLGNIQIKARTFIGWRDDGERFKEMMDHAYKDLEYAQQTCEDLTASLGVVNTRRRSTYKVLHPSTEKTLMNLSDGNSELSVFQVIKGVLSKYAGEEEHDQVDPRGLIGRVDCFEYFRRVLRRFDDDVKESIQNTCRKTVEVELCLNNLMAKNQNIKDQSRDSGNARFMYDGLFIREHSGESSLPQFERSGGRGTQR